MRRYIVKRLGSLIPVMFVVATLVFFLVHLTPGDPASVILGPDAPQEAIAELRARLGLDKPLPVQFVRWFGQVVQGDLGESIFLRRPVTQAIVERLEPTLLLAGLATLFAIAIGVPAGVLAAVYRNTWVDRLFMIIATFGVSMPNFWLALNLIFLFALTLSLLPVSGYVPLGKDSALTLRFLLLPAFSLGFPQSALIARMTRGSMLDVLSQDYVKTARAKGLSERVVIYKHALKNTMITVITVIGIVLAITLSGSVVIETIFGLPGIGRLIINSVLRRDYPVIQGTVLFVAATYVLVNLFIDLLYVYLDPRIKYQ
ncbi:MAG TPA: ABC transporter permease [Alphaproteobacteria bacterium]|nr:ABC transporter permease [Alphaproteobacteria bacterium]